MRRGLRRALLATGIAVLVLTVAPPLDEYGRRSLVGHMIQHLLHTDVVAPLLLLGLPALARPLRAVPPIPSLLFALGGIWAIHFTPLFEASLEHDGVHVLVHALFLACGLLMWAPVFDPGRLAPLLRAAYVFVALPLAGLLGFALHVTRAPLYPHYVALCGAGALADQHAGADVMWLGGCLLMFAAFMVVMLELARHEQAAA